MCRIASGRRKSLFSTTFYILSFSKMLIFLISLPVPDLPSVSTNSLIRLLAVFFCLSYTQYVLLVTNFPCLLSSLCPWNFKYLFFILSIRLLLVSIFSKIPLYLHTLVFSVPFCRTTSLLTQVSSRHELPVWHVSFTYTESFSSSRHELPECHISFTYTES